MSAQAAEAPLRIAFLADTIDDGYGGAVVSAERFVDALREDHHVTVLATGPDGEDRVSLRSLTIPLHAMRAMRFRFAIPDRERLRAVFATSDVVHLQFPFWASFNAMRLAREMDIPVVAAFHVQPENVLHNIGWNAEWPARILYRWWVKHFYNHADVVICPSELARKALTTNGLKRPTRVISNGIPRASLTPHAVRRGAAPGSPRTLLMVGRLAPEKQHAVVFEALRRCRHRDQTRLLIAGAGPLDSELRRQAADQSQIEFLGYVSDERLADLYQEADLLIHASDVELEGMVVLEAMARGLPALIAESPRSAAGQFTLSTEFRFRSGDADDLAAKLDALLANPSALVYSRGRHVRQASKYVFEDSVEALVDVYREVIGRRDETKVLPDEPRPTAPAAPYPFQKPAARAWSEELAPGGIDEGRVRQLPLP